MITGPPGRSRGPCLSWATRNRRASPPHAESPTSFRAGTAPVGPGDRIRFYVQVPEDDWDPLSSLMGDTSVEHLSWRDLQLVFDADSVTSMSRGVRARVPGRDLGPGVRRRPRRPGAGRGGLEGVDCSPRSVQRPKTLMLIGRSNFRDGAGLCGARGIGTQAYEYRITAVHLCVPAIESSHSRPE